MDPLAIGKTAQAMHWRPLKVDILVQSRITFPFDDNEIAFRSGLSPKIHGEILAAAAFNPSYSKVFLSSDFRYLAYFA
jgi:hypothetical protein